MNDVLKRLEKNELIKEIRKYNVKENLEYKYYFLIYDTEFIIFRIRGNKYIFNEFGYFESKEIILKVLEKYSKKIRSIYG